MAVNIREAIQQLSPGATVELFQLDLTSISASGGISYFHAGTNELDGPVVWQGVTYQKFPISAEGFDKNLKGTLPRPTLRVSNVTGTITAMVLQYDDLVGAKVTRKCTFVRYLDASNFTSGVNATADPNQSLDDEVFYVERKVSEDRLVVEFELVSALDFQGVQLPSRTIVVNYCASTYRRWHHLRLHGRLRVRLRGYCLLQCQ
jgi:lambda family phage minor tail protein L